MALAAGLPLPRLLAEDHGAEPAEPPREADGGALATGLEEPSVTQLADQLFKQLESEKTESTWEVVNRLARLAREHGTAITERLEKGLQAADERMRLACARALCQLSNTEQAAP
ncbi:MAG: hypothetical protein NTW87_22760, partial [Planctomycetota bacterium]|nr:hypothetical protein [Planctomycetota bacterium]